MYSLDVNPVKIIKFNEVNLVIIRDNGEAVRGTVEAIRINLRKKVIWYIDFD